MIYATQTDETITARYDAKRFLNSIPGYVAQQDARLQSDGAAYRHERRLKAIKRYLRERAAR